MAQMAVRVDSGPATVHVNIAVQSRRQTRIGRSIDCLVLSIERGFYIDLSILIPQWNGLSGAVSGKTKETQLAWFPKMNPE